jgi:hypothetical protein
MEVERYPSGNDQDSGYGGNDQDSGYGTSDPGSMAGMR